MQPLVAKQSDKINAKRPENQQAKHWHNPSDYKREEGD